MCHRDCVGPTKPYYMAFYRNSVPTSGPTVPSRGELFPLQCCPVGQLRKQPVHFQEAEWNL